MNRCLPSTAGQESASTLLSAMLMIATLSAVTGAFIMAVTSRTRTAHESASWRQAATAAESGANLALAEIRRVLPHLNRSVAGAWTGWTSSSGTLPTGHTIPAGVTLHLIPPTLTCVGEGNTVLTARVTLDAPAALVDSGGNQWLRLRSQGTALVPGSRRVSPDKMDNRLRRLALVRDTALGQKVNRPQVTRTIEMIVRPILPFRSAITTGGAINVEGRGSSVDSFDSRNALASTGGEYDSAKRRAFGHVYTNGSSFQFPGEIRGDVGTNNGNVEPSARITGTIDNDTYRPLPPMAEPSWSLLSIILSQLQALGTESSPIRYKLTGITGNYRVGNSVAGVVEVWVNGDVSGTITVDENVQARVYVDGNINLTQIKNKGKRAENLVIYGIPSSTNAARTIDLNVAADTHAAIYAPGHSMRVTGSNDFMGSLAVKSLEATGSPRFHFDEALALNAGRVIDYRIASWVEEVF
jgi:hypothetical protein